MPGVPAVVVCFALSRGPEGGGPEESRGGPGSREVQQSARGRGPDELFSEHSRDPEGSRESPSVQRGPEAKLTPKHSIRTLRALQGLISLLRAL